MATSSKHEHYVEAIQAVRGEIAEEFGLTTAEMKVAALIAEGHGLKIVARKLQLSHETVRTQLKVIFLKTDIRRQSALVVLFSSYAIVENRSRP